MYDKIKGNWATLLLPIRDDESVDYDILSDEIEYLISCNVDGIYSNGTAGEFFSQRTEEFQTISSILASICRKKGMPFQIGCSHMDPRISLERIDYAVSFIPDAIQVILPDWFPANNRAAIRFLKEAARRASGIPLVLYNPPPAKRRLAPHDFLLLIDNVPEIKRVSVFVPGHHLATGISKGAAGAYSNVACLSPVKAQLWYEMMLLDIKDALEKEKEIQRFFSLYIDPLIIEEGYPNFAIDKFLAAIGGYIKGMTSRVRFPYDSVEDSRVGYFRKKLVKTSPYFADEAFAGGI